MFCYQKYHFHVFISLSLLIDKSGSWRSWINYSWRWKFRSSRSEVFCKKDVLRNFAKFTGKYLYQSLFFNKVAALASNFVKKESLAQVISCEFCEICKNTFFYRTPQVAASKIIVFKKIRYSLTIFAFSF